MITALLFFIACVSASDSSCFTDPPAASAGTTQSGLFGSPTYRVWTHADALECFRNESYDKAASDIILAEARNVFSMYSYTARMARGGVHVSDDLTSIEAMTFTNQYDFYAAVMGVFNKLKDRHTKFVLPPVFAQFQTMRPFMMTIRSRVVLNVTSHYLTAYRETFPLGTGWLKAPISYPTTMTPLLDLLSLKKLEPVEIVTVDGVPAVEWATQFAAANSGLRNESAQINYALQTSFVRFMQTDVFPTKSEEVFEVLINGQIESITVPVKLLQKISTGTNPQTPTHKPGGGGGGGGGSHPPGPNTHSPATHKPTHKPATFPLKSHRRRDRAEWQKSNYDVFPLTQYEFPPEYAYLTTYPKNSEPMISAIITCGQYTNSVAPFQLSAILTIASFNIVASTNDTLEEIAYIKVIKECVKEYVGNMHVNRLIIDVRGNPGGYIHIFAQTLAVLLPDFRPVLDLDKMKVHVSKDMVVFPTYDFAIAPKTRVDPQIGAWLDSKLLDESVNVSTLTFLPHSQWWRDVNPSHVADDKLVTYSPFFKRTYPVNLNTTDDDTKLPDVGFARIIVLTDGLCGSACAQFVSKLDTSGKARVVSVGGLSGVPNVPSSYAGGIVIDHSEIASGFGWSPLPNGTSMSFNWLEFFVDGEATPMEFQNRTTKYHVDERYPYDDTRVYHALAKMFESEWNETTGWTKMPPLPVEDNTLGATLMMVIVASSVLVTFCCGCALYVCVVTKPKQKLTSYEKEVLMTPLHWEKLTKYEQEILGPLQA